MDQIIKHEAGMVIHTFNVSTQEAEAERLWIQGQSEVCSELMILSQKNYKPWKDCNSETHPSINLQRLFNLLGNPDPFKFSYSEFLEETAI